MTQPHTHLAEDLDIKFELCPSAWLYAVAGLMRNLASQHEVDSPVPIIIAWSGHNALSALQGRHLRHSRMKHWANSHLPFLIAELVCLLDFCDFQLQMLVLTNSQSHIFSVEHPSGCYHFSARAFGIGF